MAQHPATIENSLRIGSFGNFELAVLVTLERRLLRRLPKEYRQFIVSLNGGAISVDHELKTMIEGWPYELGVVGIFPLNGSGVVDIQDRWRQSNVGSDLVLPIADDGGTGFYFLMLDNDNSGKSTSPTKMSFS